MISSMTGYAECKFEFAWGVIIWKLRSVNHRGIEITLRTPEELRAFENSLRRCILGRIERGRIDATLMLAELDDATVGRQPDRKKIAELSAQSDLVRSVMPDAQQLSVREVLTWPDVVPVADLATDEISAQVLKALDTTLQMLIEIRKNEGAGIREFLDQKTAELNEMLDSAHGMIPAVETEFRTRMDEAIKKLNHEVDAARMEQEIAVMMIKADVSEELNRLKLHLNEVERILKEETVVGKRLGFLAQELQREANTLASKAAHHPLNVLMVDAKVVIDQVREQAQNIE